MNALRFLTVEGLSDLACQVGEREPQQLRRVLDGQLDRPLALAEGVGHLVDTFILSQPVPELLCGGPQLADVRPRELDVHVVAGLEQG